MEVKLPEYISIKNYRKIVSLEHLSDNEKVLAQVSILTGVNLDEVRNWTGDQFNNIVDDMTQLIESTKPEFYPLIEYNGKTYGFAALSKMTLGEYVDIENLCKNVNDNLSELMAIFYRETTDNKFDSFKWKLKHRVKLAIEKTENLFKYYKIKPYNSEIRSLDAEVFEEFPVQYLLGALFFFTLIRTNYLNDILLSSDNEMNTMTNLMVNEMKELSVSIGDGLAQFMVYQKPISFQSQEIKVSLT
jgi:hypothetical protein